MAKAPYIEDGRLRHLLQVAAISREFPLRNVALLTAVYGTGMMLTEISRLPVRAYLNGDGSIDRKNRETAMPHGSLCFLFAALFCAPGALVETVAPGALNRIVPTGSAIAWVVVAGLLLGGASF